jgi:hypothetical protein
MKKLSLSIIIALIFGFSVNSVAQKSTAYLDSKTSKQVVDEKLLSVNFKLDNVSSNEARLKYENLFKAFQGVKEVSSTSEKGNMAVYTIKINKKGGANAIQNMLASADIQRVNVDGKEFATARLAEYIRSNNQKK